MKSRGTEYDEREILEATYTFSVYRERRINILLFREVKPLCHSSSLRFYIESVGSVTYSIASLYIHDTYACKHP